MAEQCMYCGLLIGRECFDPQACQQADQAASSETGLSDRGVKDIMAANDHLEDMVSKLGKKIRDRFPEEWANIEGTDGEVIELTLDLLDRLWRFEN